MKKHPLLPDNYVEASLQSSILFALGPYKLTQNEDVANPQTKWDLAKAWQDAQEHLRRAHWMHAGDAATPLKEIAEYELSADTDAEITQLNVILAGLVACQILDPDKGIFVCRVEYRKGGEMTLAVSPSVAQMLRKKFPDARFGAHADNKELSFSNKAS